MSVLYVVGKLVIVVVGMVLLWYFQLYKSPLAVEKRQKRRSERGVSTAKSPQGDV